MKILKTLYGIEMHGGIDVESVYANFQQESFLK